ncbi:MAG: DUF885 domain-containing protein [Candidatus Eremiobacteraeota bacterium]|nr:DUF885 domain-containing protein [Candidatus Eremiobacteraeota bacterium]
MKSVVVAILGVALLAAGPASAPKASNAVDAFASRYFAHQLETNDDLRAELGKPIEAIRSISPANAASDAAFGQSILDGLKAIDSTSLDHDRWLTYRTLKFLASNDVAAQKYYWLTQQATPYAGGLRLGAINKLFLTFRFANEDDSKRYVKLVGDYAAFVRSIGDLLEGQHARGFILPNIETAAAQSMFTAYDVPAAESPLVVSDARLQALPPAERISFSKEVGAAISGDLVPAFDRVVAYLKGPYRQGAPSGVGLGQYPGGAEYYQHLILLNTTLSTSARALHDTGLREVSRLNAQLESIRVATHFAGNLAAFKRYLSTSKQFYVKTTPEFGDRLDLYVKRAAQAVPSFFAHTPKTPYGIAPVPKALAAGQTFGYYDWPTADRKKGIYLYNAWHPERTSALGAGALICHELVPGHHFQVALQQENSTLPDLRRYDFSENGFLEGWGEYASQLCWDMGVYRTPYDKAGRLLQDLMVSTRLVVDTGMNAMGWSHERAMAYMRDNLVISNTQIRTESLRYSTDIPGQALAYKTGELAMLAIRNDAKAKLGSAFDMRTFHSWLIDSGSMTLDTLRQHVDYEIAKTKKRNS